MKAGNLILLHPTPWTAQRRSKRRRGVSKKLLLVALGAMVLSSFGVFGLYLYISQAPNPTEQLDIALRLMRRGDVDTAARIAESIKASSVEKKSDHSKRHFLMGTNQRLRAKTIEQRPIANGLNEKAVEHLEKSRDYSFPDGYEGAGNYHLGMALYDLFRWEEAEEPLKIAADRWPPGRADAYDRLVDIDLSQNRKDPDAALDKIEHWRTLPRSSAFDDERADVKEMQTRIEAGDYDLALAIEPRIGSDSPYRPLCDLYAGRCYLKKAPRAATPEERVSQLDNAERALKDVLKSPKTSVPIRRQANLELGRVKREQGKLQEAVSTFSILRLSSAYEPENLAAAIEEIDTLIQLNRTNDVIDTLAHLTSNMGELKWYQNDWFPINDMRKRLVAAGNKLIDLGEYSTASKFSKNLPTFCDRLDRLRLDSRLYELWAKEKESKGDEKKHEYFLLSGQAYEALTRSLARSMEFDEWLWHAIDNYRRAGAFKESNRLLDRYLEIESRTNRPKGYLVQAKNLQSLDKIPEAMNSLEKLLSGNTTTPLAYDARLDLARLKAKMSKYDEAELLVRENLSGDLKPESPIWQESLFELGEMLFARGEKQLLDAKNEMEANPSKTLENFSRIEASYDLLKKSVDRLEEFLRRFERDNRRFQILYHMAKAYQLSAFWPELQLRENRSTNEDTIRSLKSQRKELLVKSRNAYARLRQEILSDSNRGEQGPNVEDLLRNSYFGEADLFFFEEDYNEAITAYTDAANRFINEPESLEARKQIALCQKYLGKTQECRRSLEYAKDLLKRIPPEKDSKFKIVTSHDRAGWQQYLDSMLTELNNPNGTSNP